MSSKPKNGRIFRHCQSDHNTHFVVRQTWGGLQGQTVSFFHRASLLQPNCKTANGRGLGCNKNTTNEKEWPFLLFVRVYLSRNAVSSFFHCAPSLFPPSRTRTLIALDTQSGCYCVSCHGKLNLSSIVIYGHGVSSLFLFS